MHIPVASRNNLGIRTLAVRELEQTEHLSDSLRGRAIGSKVTFEVCRVLATDALDPDVIGTQGCLQTISKRWTDKRSLQIEC